MEYNDYYPASTATAQTVAQEQTARRLLFRNVYLWMTLALVITAFASLIVYNSPSMLQAIFGSKILFYGLLIGELALVIILSARINKLSFFTATLMFVLYSILTGVTLSFIYLVYEADVIFTTFLVTAGTFAAMAIIGTVVKKDLSRWGQIFYMALIGLIIASVVNLFLKSEGMYWIITYAGVLIFVGLTAFDANKIKQMLNTYGTEVNESTQKIALMGALTLYLDFINLFLYLLRIFGGSRD
jgi:FtsH-binding integral membrane protein